MNHSMICSLQVYIFKICTIWKISIYIAQQKLQYDGDCPSISVQHLIKIEPVKYLLIHTRKNVFMVIHAKMYLWTFVKCIYGNFGHTSKNVFMDFFKIEAINDEIWHCFILTGG